MTRNEAETRKRRQIGEVFKRAKTKVMPEIGFPETGQTRYICYAISSSIPAGATREDMEFADAAEAVITNRISPHAFLDEWVLKNAPGARELLNQDFAEFHRQMQGFRHRWLDALIKEFSE